MIKIDPLRASVGAVVGLAAAAIAYAAIDVEPVVAYAAAGVGAVIIVLMTAAVGGRTLSDLRARRRRFRRALTRRWQAMLYSTSGVGTVWDGRSATMTVAFAPKPWQISVVDRPDPILPRPVPMDLLRDYLVQGDVACERINVVQMGYRRFARTDFARVYEDAVGQTPLPTSLTTVIEVTVNLDRSMAAVWRRNVSDSVPAALGATTQLVAARLARALNVEGYEARLSTAREIKWMHESILAWTNDGLQNEQWDHLGGAGMPVAVSRPGEWTPRAAEKWWSVPADRMAAVFSLQQGRFSTESTHAQFAYVYPAADKFPDREHFLDRAVGAQGDAVTEMLPLAVNDNPTAPDRLLGSGQEYPVTVPGTGLGVYLGVDDDGGRVFMNPQTGGEVLWVHAPAQFVASLTARISTIGGFVGIHLDGAGWEMLCERVNPNLMFVRPDKRMSVEVYKDRAPEVKDATAIIVWCPKKLPANTTYALVMDRHGHAVISTPDGERRFQWAPSAEEMSFLPSSAPAPQPAPA